jgi:hypothetical protein
MRLSLMNDRSIVVRKRAVIRGTRSRYGSMIAGLAALGLLLQSALLVLLFSFMRAPSNASVTDVALASLVPSMATKRFPHRNLQAISLLPRNPLPDPSLRVVCTRRASHGVNGAEKRHCYEHHETRRQWAANEYGGVHRAGHEQKPNSRIAEARKAPHCFTNNVYRHFVATRHAPAQEGGKTDNCAEPRRGAKDMDDIAHEMQETDAAGSDRGKARSPRRCDMGSQLTSEVKALAV